MATYIALESLTAIRVTFTLNKVSGKAHPLIVLKIPLNKKLVATVLTLTRERTQSLPAVLLQLPVSTSGAIWIATATQNTIVIMSKARQLKIVPLTVPSCASKGLARRGRSEMVVGLVGTLGIKVVNRSTVGRVVKQI